MLLIALVWAAIKDAPFFLLVLLSILLVLFMLLYAGAYVLFGLKDPNLLRSERYNIEKMAIEHGILGDSVTGLIEVSGGKKRAQPLIEATPDLSDD